MKEDQTTLVAAQMPTSDVAEMDEKRALLGLSRSEFIRRACRNTQVVRVEVMQVQPMVLAL